MKGRVDVICANFLLFASVFMDISLIRALVAGDGLLKGEWGALITSAFLAMSALVLVNCAAIIALNEKEPFGDRNERPEVGQQKNEGGVA